MLKTIFNCVVLMLFMMLQQAPARADSDPMQSVQRVAALVDYVAADYAGAVRDGAILSQSEFDEQHGLLVDARNLVPGLPGDEAARAALLADVNAVLAAVEARQPPKAVQERCRAVRTDLGERFHLHMVPAGPVSLQRAAALYQTTCAVCHGTTGQADTPQAAALKPPPLSFFDEERMSRVAPSLAFHTLTFGVPGTAMASFDSLSQSDRWALAFYVVSLRHAVSPAGSATGSPAVSSNDRVAGSPIADLKNLSERSDNELIDQIRQLQPVIADPAAVRRALSYLRVTTPFAAAEGGIYGPAEKLLSQTLSAMQAGQRDAAHQLALSAYLDGFEPHEAALRARDPELVLRLERSFMDLRELTDARSPDLSALSRHIAATRLLLDQARHLDDHKSAGAVAFGGALVIALREGLEAALLIAALLAFLRKSGRSSQAYLVHLGWGLSVPLGVIIFLLAGALLSGARRELAEAVTTLLAAAMLLTVTHWVLGAKEAKNWLGFLRRKVAALGPGAGAGGAGAVGDHALGLFGLSFFAAGREVFEVVLFYRALLLDVGQQAWRQVALGALCGVAIMVAVVLVVGRIGRRLNPRPVMLISGVLLSVLSISLAGHGIRALQEGGYLGVWPVTLLGHELGSLPALGLYATWQGLGVQALVTLLLFLPSIVERCGSRLGRRTQQRQAPRQAGPAQSAVA